MTNSVLGDFADLLPLVAQFAPIDRTIEQIRAVLEVPAGIDPALLGEDAAVLRQVLIEAESQWQEQAGLARALPDYWRGDAAARAQEVMLGDVVRAAGALGSVREAVEAIEAAQTALAAVLRGRSDALGCLTGTVDGRGAASIAAMLERAIDGQDQECASWLHGVFVPQMRESIEVVDDICAAANTAVTATMEVLDRTLAQVDEQAIGFAAAALAGAGGIAIAAGGLALAVGAEIAGEFARPEPPQGPESGAEPPGSLTPGAESTTPGEQRETEGSATAGVPPKGEPALLANPPSDSVLPRNEPAISMDSDTTKPDGAQEDSAATGDEPPSAPGGEPLLASVGDEPVGGGVEPGVVLGEAGPL